MNSRAFVLGIDVGTSAVRVVAVSDRSTIIGHAQATIEPTRHAVHGVTQCPSTWWRATQAALMLLGQKLDLREARVLAVDATSGTVLAVDELGRTLTQGRMYNDNASPSTVAALERIIPKDNAARGASSPLARMIEMQRPAIYKFLHQADWLTAQFTGRFDISDENNALKSGFDPIARKWPDWIRDTALDQQLLPRVVPAGTELGFIRSEVASGLGLDPNLRIVAGTTDGCASFIGSGAHRLGDAVTSLGTTLTLKQICSKPIAVAKFGVYSHRLGDHWICGGASNTGGAALLKFFTKEQIFEMEASLIPEHDTDLGYYPLPAVGERFPVADPFLQPIMHPRPHEDARFLQGLLEGIARIERTGYSCLQAFGAPSVKCVFTVGGGSRNEAWRRIRERVLQIPVTRGFADAAYGAALISLSAFTHTPLLECGAENARGGD